MGARAGVRLLTNLRIIEGGGPGEKAVIVLRSCLGRSVPYCVEIHTALIRQIDFSVCCDESRVQSGDEARKKVGLDFPVTLERPVIKLFHSETKLLISRLALNFCIILMKHDDDWSFICSVGDFCSDAQVPNVIRWVLEVSHRKETALYFLLMWR